MTGRDYPRPWVERRYTPARTVVLLLACLVLVAVFVVGLADDALDEAPPVTPATAPGGEAVPYQP